MPKSEFFPSQIFKIAENSTLAQKVLRHSITILLGVTLLWILAQVTIPLPFTPVPITGQTFGVALLSLILGWKHSVATTVSYLGLATLGLPILASGGTFVIPGPTTGYLLGMVASSCAIGFLSDRGWGRHFLSAFAACVIGSILVFIFGLSFLAIFFSRENLLAVGLFPFLPGDLLKSLLAALIGSRVLGSRASK